MNGKLPLAIWLVFTLAGMVPIDAAKAVSRGSNHKNKAHSPNHDHVRLTHAVSSQSHHNAPSRSYPNQQQHVQQSHTHQQASAPALPSHVQSNAAAIPTAKPIGWNVPQSNTNTGFQQPHAAVAAPPAAHSPHAPNTNAGAPPPYSPNTNFNHQSADFHPGQNAGAHNVGGYPQQQHPQAPFNGNPAGSYPIQQQPGYIPSAGQQYPGGVQQSGYPVGHQPGYPVGQQPGYPVGQQPGYPIGQQPGYPIGQQPSYPGVQKSSGLSSGPQTAAIAGIGGLALYGALKPSEEKTIIIHEGGQAAAAPATVPASPPGVAPAPLAPAVQPVAPVVQPAAVPVVSDATAQPQAPTVPVTSGVFVTPVPSSGGVPIMPLAPMPLDQQQLVPLAPLPDQSTAVPLAPLADQTTAASQAPLADQTTAVPLAALPVQSAVVSMAPTPVPNAPVVETTTTRSPDPVILSNHTATKEDAAPLKGAAANFVILNMSFYACISIALAQLI